MARRTDVKGDTAFWTAGIVVVIFTGREQLNVQKKKKVNDDQNEKKNKTCVLDGSAENIVLLSCSFSRFERHLKTPGFSLFWFDLSNMVKMWCLKWDCPKSCHFVFISTSFVFFTYNFFGVVFQAASKKKYKKDKTSLTKREEYLVKPNTGKSLFQDNTKWCGLITT